MYYLVPNERKEAGIYGYKPEGEYLSILELPDRLPSKIGQQTRLYVDVESGRVWWDYVSEQVISGEEKAAADSHIQKQMELLRDCMLELSEEIYGGA